VLEPPSHGSPQRPIDRNRRMGAGEVGERRGKTQRSWESGPPPHMTHGGPIAGRLEATRAKKGRGGHRGARGAQREEGGGARIAQTPHDEIAGQREGGRGNKAQTSDDEIAGQREGGRGNKGNGAAGTHWPKATDRQESKHGRRGGRGAQRDSHRGRPRMGRPGNPLAGDTKVGERGGRRARGTGLSDKGRGRRRR
jgi:hypothetical protein